MFSSELRCSPLRPSVLDAGSGSAFSAARWASWHRRHHKYVDTPADPHSPLVYGFWYSHVAWVFDPKNDTTDLSNVRDLTRFPELRLLDRFAWVPLVAYALLCYAIAGLPGATWGFVSSARRASAGGSSTRATTRS
jgi:fatty-acid desaturase